MQSYVAILTGLVASLASRPAARPELYARAESASAGLTHQEALLVEDGSFPEDYVNELRLGILNITAHGRGGRPRPYQFAQAFSSAYTFFYTSTLAGLSYAPAVLGLPLARFLHRGVDPQCNAFFLNAVVLFVGAAPARPPWHDFAITVHADQSLRVYAPEVALPDDGTARTVVILYLSDLHVGGELEVYDHYEAAEAVHKSAERDAAVRCRGVPGARRGRCESRVIDRAISNTTLGRLLPRKGRLAKFRGSHSHAVRRLRGAPGGARISLVLEQFSLPPSVLGRIPMVWSERGGSPLFSSDVLRERFVAPSGGPRLWGEP